MDVFEDDLMEDVLQMNGCFSFTLVGQIDGIALCYIKIGYLKLKVPLDLIHNIIRYE